MQLYFLCKTCKIGTYVLEVIEKCTDQNLGGDGLPPQGSFCETLILTSGCHYEKNAANYAQKAMVSS